MVLPANRSPGFFQLLHVDIGPKDSVIEKITLIFESYIVLVRSLVLSLFYGVKPIVNELCLYWGREAEVAVRVLSLWLSCSNAFDNRVPVLAAIAQKNHGAVRAIMHGINLAEECNANGENAFLVAARLGDLPLLKYFIKNHREIVNSTNSFGQSALHLAIRHYHFEAVEHLIKECPDLLNVQDKQGYTALHYMTELVKHNHAIEACAAHVTAVLLKKIAKLFTQMPTTDRNMVEVYAKRQRADIWGDEIELTIIDLWKVKSHLSIPNQKRLESLFSKDSRSNRKRRIDEEALFFKRHCNGLVLGLNSVHRKDLFKPFRSRRVTQSLCNYFLDDQQGVSAVTELVKHNHAIEACAAHLTAILLKKIAKLFAQMPATHRNKVEVYAKRQKVDVWGDEIELIIIDLWKVKSHLSIPNQKRLEALFSRDGRSNRKYRIEEEVRFFKEHCDDLVLGLNSVHRKDLFKPFRSRRGTQSLCNYFLDDQQVVSAVIEKLQRAEKALCHKQLQLVKELLPEEGNLAINLELVSNLNESVLHLAFKKAPSAVIEYLIPHLAFKKAPSAVIEHLIPHLASKKARSLVREYLVGQEHGFLFTPDATGCLPLHFALDRGNYAENGLRFADDSTFRRIVEFLISEDVDTKTRQDNLRRVFSNKDRNGLTVLCKLVRNNRIDLVRIIVDRFQVFSSALERPRHSRRVSFSSCEPLDGSPVAQSVIDLINDFLPWGDTLLHIAARFGNLDLIEYLVGKGASVDAVNKDGWTAFDIAVFNAFDIMGDIDNERRTIALTLFRLAPGVVNQQKTRQISRPDIENRGEEHSSCKDSVIQVPQNTLLYELVERKLYREVRFIVDELHAQDDSFQLELGGLQGAQEDSVMHAAARSTPKIFSYLLRRGAPMDLLDHKGQQPVFTCVKRVAEDLYSENTFGVFSSLWKQGAVFFNQLDSQGRSPLYWALAHGAELPVIEKMVELGADLCQELGNSQTILHAAAKNCSIDVLNYLFDQLGPEAFNRLNKEDLPAIHYLVKRALQTQKATLWMVVERLVNTNRIDCNYGTDQSERLSVTLIKYGATQEQFNFFVINGMEISTTLRNGRNLVHEAVESQRLDLLTYLSEHGIDLGLPDSNDYTPLALAMNSLSNVVESIPRHTEIVCFLLEKGAPIFPALKRLFRRNPSEASFVKTSDLILSTNFSGHSLLWHAVNHSEFKAVRYLSMRIELTNDVLELSLKRAFGVVEIDDSQVDAAIQIAHLFSKQPDWLMTSYKFLEQQEPYTEEIRSPVRLFLRHTYRGNTLMHVATRRNDVKSVHFLLDLQIPINEENEVGETPLQIALVRSFSRDASCSKNKAAFEIVELLKNAIFEEFEDEESFLAVMRLNSSGFLEQAIEKMNLSGLRYIVEELHVNPSALLQNNQTAIHLAISMRRDVSVIRYLIESEVDVNQVDEVGVSPLGVACSQLPLIPVALEDAFSPLEDVPPGEREFYETGLGEEPLQYIKRKQGIREGIRQLYPKMQNRNRRAIKVVALLVRSGANLNIQIPEVGSIADLAEQEDSSELKTALEERGFYDDLSAGPPADDGLGSGQHTSESDVDSD